jgi:predicted DNA-binding transcriptional regulator AlpA
MYHENVKDDPLLTAEQVAAMLGIQVKTWTAYVQRGQPRDNPAPKPRRGDMALINGRWRVRWRQSAITAWTAARNPRSSSDLRRPGC